jgi:hypothetical protein
MPAETKFILKSEMEKDHERTSPDLSALIGDHVEKDTVAVCLGKLIAPSCSTVWTLARQTQVQRPCPIHFPERVSVLSPGSVVGPRIHPVLVGSHASCCFKRLVTDLRQRRVRMY